MSIIELSDRYTGEPLYLNTESIAVIAPGRGSDETFTEILLTMQGPRETGPVCYHVKEAQESVWRAYMKAKSSEREKMFRALSEVMQAAHT